MGLNPSDTSGTTNSIPVNLDLGLKGQPVRYMNKNQITHKFLAVTSAAPYA